MIVLKENKTIEESSKTTHNEISNASGNRESVMEVDKGMKKMKRKKNCCEEKWLNNNEFHGVAIDLTQVDVHNRIRSLRWFLDHHDAINHLICAQSAIENGF